MDSLMKIKDITSEYHVSARALRYYEEMGLIQSVRSDDYAYRMYDTQAVGRLRQILILRRLGVSIKDIRSVLSTPGTDAVLDVLQKKAEDIDDEVAILHELKGIVLDFIRQIETMDLSVQANIKLLYDKTRSLEDRLVRTDYAGNPANVHRLLEISESLKKLPDVRIYEIPACRMVASQPGLFGDGKLEAFDAWFSQFPRDVFPKDYLTSNKEGQFIWLYLYAEGMQVPESFDIIDFPGGLYAVATGVDADDTGYENAHKAIKRFIEEKECFVLDETRSELGNVITPPAAQEAMGYGQMDHWVPIKVKRA